MAERAKSLRRIAAVQQEMVRLSEWRVAAAGRLCQDLADDKTRLQGYVVEQGALGVNLAKAALRSLHGLDGRLAQAERLRAASQTALVEAKRRAHVADGLFDRVDRMERREQEGRELAATIDAWLLGSKAP